ncbi:unnamed protein product [Nezara viridula]|uniref:Uncharacterized protein n=1 Tax=Nezara viridula TaxID=85310 RepID=A0A9P0H9Z6_NEZVI|nr:unnamed protein product [Nezara viridula]
MPDGTSHNPSLVIGTNSNQEIDKINTIESSSVPVVASVSQFKKHAIRRNKKINRGMKLLNKVNRDSEEYKKMMWEKFIANEKKKRIFESFNPRDTLPSPYIKTLEEAYITRQKFKHYVMVSGVTIKSRRTEKEPSVPSLELKSYLSCTTLTNLENIENQARKDEDHKSHRSPSTISSLRLDDLDGTSRDELQIQQPNEYRELPCTSTEKSTNEEKRKASEETLLKTMEQKYQENQMADKQEIKQTEIIIVGYFLNDDIQEEKKVTFDLNATQIDKKSIPDNVENKSEKSQEGTITDIASTSRNDSGLQSMEKSAHKRTGHGSHAETISASESSLSSVDIQNKKRSHSLLRRFIRRFSDTDRKSSTVGKFINQKLDQVVERPSQESVHGMPSQEQIPTSEGRVKKAWEKTKKFCLLGLAANESENTDRPTHPKDNISKADSESEVKNEG